MKSSSPVVGIIMGSDSDLPVMQEAAKVLEEFGISHELTVVSAHRTPDRLVTYAKEAADKGLKVIIAGAGGAAHLPGMTAAMTTLPVIGVPIKTSTAAGLDSLFSVAQMPPGIPVATVAINGAKNAGIMAARIIATFDKGISKKIQGYQDRMKSDVLAKAEQLEKQGFATYLQEKQLL